MKDRLSTALAKVGDALARIDENAIESATQMIARANIVGLYGCGREGFQMRGFAMRLFHLGLNVGYVGDTTMPPLGKKDLLFVSSGPGGLSTVEAHMNTASSARAAIVLVTAQPDGSATSAADLVVTIPAQTMASDVGPAENDLLPMGSVYEGALFFLFEWIVADLKSIMGETANTMRARHTNME